MYGNYEYSLTSKAQSEIQIWLRGLPEKYRDGAWYLLHDLTYTDNWTETPETEMWIDINA